MLYQASPASPRAGASRQDDGHEKAKHPHGLVLHVFGKEPFGHQTIGDSYPPTTCEIVPY